MVRNLKKIQFRVFKVIFRIRSHSGIVCVFTGTAVALRTAAPLLWCPWWATSWVWEIATEKTSSLTLSLGNVFTSTSTASSTRFVFVLKYKSFIFIIYIVNISIEIMKRIIDIYIYRFYLLHFLWSPPFSCILSCSFFPSPLGGDVWRAWGGSLPSDPEHGPRHGAHGHRGSLQTGLWGHPEVNERPERTAHEVHKY